MQIEVLHQYESRLPPDDDHPYRTGAWRPQTTERRAWDLDVEGSIPDDLNGVYIRNTENPLHPAMSFYHPFDGDGMLHSISFAAGEAVYHNRFVRTAGLEAEVDAGEALWAGFIESPDDARREDGWGARGRMKDASSTDVVVHRGEALSSFWQCGDLYRLDPVTLETLGPEDWGGSFPAEGVSAHTKVDEGTGELLFFNYGTESPYMHYGEISADGELAHYVDVPLPGPRLPHDMAFTERFAILNDCPLFWEPRELEAGVYRPRWHPDLPTRFGIVPRRGTDAEIRWFEAEPTFVLHWINAYEDGDEIVLDGFFQHDPAPRPRPTDSFEDAVFRSLDLYALKAEARRWRFDLTTGQTKEEPLSDRVMEFGMINGRHGGRPYRYAYNALPCEGWFGFRGLVKHDLHTGREEVVELPDGVYASETVMAPRDGATAEDDGYLLTYVSDVNADASACLVFDAADPTAGPLARVALPERISSGTHATWAPADALG
jgi:carotenoid cleavage dioxygenase